MTFGKESFFCVLIQLYFLYIFLLCFVFFPYKYVWMMFLVLRLYVNESRIGCFVDCYESWGSVSGAPFPRPFSHSWITNLLLAMRPFLGIWFSSSSSAFVKVVSVANLIGLASEISPDKTVYLATFLLSFPFVLFPWYWQVMTALDPLLVT